MEPPFGGAEGAMRLQLAQPVGKETPAAPLRAGIVVDGRSAVDAADEPFEHTERRRAAQAIRAGNGRGGRADRPAVVAHAGGLGAPSAPVTPRRCTPALEIAVGLSHPPRRSPYERNGARARGFEGKSPCQRGCEVTPVCGNLVGSAQDEASFPPAHAP
jgi:hypothetical protein